MAPFVAEELYQNLVCSVDPDAPDSVHLADYPTAEESLIDQQLMEATRLAMRIASMGRGARSKAGIKVRQPLGKVVINTRSVAEIEIIRQISRQILDELNIKSIDEVDQAGIADAAKASLSGETEGIVQVDRYWVALEGGYMVAVDATITPELAEEGLARELVHRIQNLRRAADFQVTDRIVTYCQAPEEITRVLTGSFADYIRQETLTEELVTGPPPEEAKAETTKVEGLEVTLAVRRV